MLAYKAFAANEINDSVDSAQNGKLIIDIDFIKEVYKEFLSIKKVTSEKMPFANLITKLNKFGILVSIKGALNISEANHEFVHYTFQEYFQAKYLVQRLGSENLAIAKATYDFISEHRYAQKYLMTWKFMAGMVTDLSKEGEDDKSSLLTRFWEAVSCEGDGYSEFGVKHKVELWMHLLDQSERNYKISESETAVKTDQRIPNIVSVKEIINNELARDYFGYSNTISESGYGLKHFVERLLKKLPQNAQWSDEISERMDALLTVCVCVKKEYKEKILEKISQLITSNSEQIKAKAITLLPEFVKKLCIEREEKFLFVEIVLDKALLKNLTDPLREFLRISPDVSDHVIKILKSRLNDDACSVSESVCDALSTVVEASPEKAEEVLKLLKPLLQDTNNDIRKFVCYAIGKVVEASPEQAGEVLELLEPLVKDAKYDFLTFVLKLKESISNILPQEIDWVNQFDSLLKINGRGALITKAHELLSTVKSGSEANNEMIAKFLAKMASAGCVFICVHGKEVLSLKFEDKIYLVNEDCEKKLKSEIRDTPLLSKFCKEVEENLANHVSDIQSEKEIEANKMTLLNILEKISIYDHKFETCGEFTNT